MVSSRPPPPVFTWEDLEAVLTDLAGPSLGQAVMPHYLQDVEQAASREDPQQFLKELIHTGLVLDQLGATDTGRPLQVGLPVWPSSS